MSSTANLNDIRKKVESGERLTLEDGLLLYHADTPLQEVGELANIVRERINGNIAYYNINTHLNPTNICVYRCNFCAFRADLRDQRGYVMSDQEVLQRGQEATENGCTEVHIVGGLHHQKEYSWYLNLIQILVEISKAHTLVVTKNASNFNCAGDMIVLELEIIFNRLILIYRRILNLN